MLLLTMVISFCAFCSIQKETDSLKLEKRAIDFNTFKNYHGEPQKIGNSYLTEDDIFDSDEDTVFEVKKLPKHYGKHHQEIGYDYPNEYPGSGKGHHKKVYNLKNKIPKTHNVITTQPKKSSSEEIITYNIGENIYAGMDRHLPQITDFSELGQAEFKTFSIKHIKDEPMDSSEILKFSEAAKECEYEGNTEQIVSTGEIIASTDRKISDEKVKDKILESTDQKVLSSENQIVESNPEDNIAVVSPVISNMGIDNATDEISNADFMNPEVTIDLRNAPEVTNESEKSPEPTIDSGKMPVNTISSESTPVNSTGITNSTVNTTSTEATPSANTTVMEIVTKLPTIEIVIPAENSTDIVITEVQSVQNKKLEEKDQNTNDKEKMTTLSTVTSPVITTQKSR